ncbi:MAG: hypothetical protein PVG22_02470 [Chromatiales bacterium]
MIQKITPEALWDETIGQWAGPSVGAALVNVAVCNGNWSTEITSGGVISICLHRNHNKLGEAGRPSPAYALT